MALRKRGGIWYFRKMINGRLFRESTGFADRKAAERRANEIELDIRAGVHGWKSTIPSFAEWWDIYRKTYTPQKSARNRDAQIVAHFLPHFGARRLDDITKSDIVRYLNLRRTQMTGNPGHKKRRLVSDSTVRRERGLLQSIFERAIDEGHDIRNPFRGIKRGKDKPRTRVLTLDEETPLLEALHPRFQRFVRFALGTGCRLDEIRGIYLSATSIGCVERSTSSASSARNVTCRCSPMPERRWRNSSRRKASCGNRIHNGYVRSWRKGQRGRRFRRSLRTCCATPSGRAGFRPAAISTSCRRSSGTPASP
jgi:hypothetical protein